MSRLESLLFVEDDISRILADCKARGKVAPELEKALADVRLRLEALRAKAGPVVKRQECGWRAGGCLGSASHLVRVRFRPKNIEMCARCAAIFDPSLGATSGYIYDFVARCPIDPDRAAGEVLGAILASLGA